MLASDRTDLMNSSYQRETMTIKRGSRINNEISTFHLSHETRKRKMEANEIEPTAGRRRGTADTRYRQPPPSDGARGAIEAGLL